MLQISTSVRLLGRRVLVSPTVSTQQAVLSAPVLLVTSCPLIEGDVRVSDLVHIKTE